MQTKLTLRLEERLIKRAKAWAKWRRLSLSQAVAAIFAQLPESAAPVELTPWTRRLAGSSTQGKPLTDDEIQREYLAHLEAKHR